MKTLIAAIGLALMSLAGSPSYAQDGTAQGTIALVGGTLIDVSNSGHSARDIPNSVVVLRAGKIEAVGPAALVKVSQGRKDHRLQGHLHPACRMSAAGS
jgi:hypothetical protein